MRLLKLAIVGRPNVGKSALFNRICKQKISIVDEAEGVTRDRLYARAELFGLPFEVIDTGGIHAGSKALFNEEIKRQAEIAIEEADVLIQVVDAQVGVTTLDEQVAKILLRTKKPVCLAVNKIDHPQQKNEMIPFYALGISKIVPVSAAQGWQIAELLESALEGFSPASEEEETCGTKVAIVGRPNVGKSSLVNFILQEDRCVVSPIPGTTRDSVDITFTIDGAMYTLIDTAGIRRKKAEHEVVDKFAAIRTARAIERADLCLLMLDAQEGMTAQDKKIANQIETEGKGCVILLNKWDLVKGFRMEHCLKSLEQEVPFLQHCPKIFLSAKTGRNVEKIFPQVQTVAAHSKNRISTGQLNRFIESAMQKNHPPMLSGKRLRIYYMTQIDISPPRFLLFVNQPKLMRDTYQKYLYNQFREEYGFEGVPLVFHLRGKETQERERGVADEVKEQRTQFASSRDEEGDVLDNLEEGDV